MPKEHAYQLINVETDIYCSSSIDHFVTLAYWHNGEWRCGDFWFEGDCIETYSRRESNSTPLNVKFPAYFVKAVKAAILAKLPTSKVYERDREGGKRYEDLRYHHDPDWVQRWINHLTTELNPK